MKHLVRSLLILVLTLTSAAEAFSQSCDPVTTINPPNGGSIQRTGQGSIFFRWAAYPGATSYDIFFGPPGQGCNAQPRATVTGTDWQPPANEVQNGASYEWQVFANGTQCPQRPRSGCKTFTVASCPTAPTPLAPANQSQLPPGQITLQWSSVPNVHDYLLYIGLDGAQPTLHSMTTTTSATISVAAGRSVYWYVAAVAHGCQPAGSAASRFTTTTLCPTAQPQLVGPANGTTLAESQATFRWNAVSGATRYGLFVAFEDETEFRQYGQTAGTSLEAFVPPGRVRWFVVAVGAQGCEPVRSPIGNFIVAPPAPQCPDVTLNLTAPADNAAATSPVRFAWTAVPNARLYRVWVSLEGAAPHNVARTTDTSAEVSLPAGNYTWYVEVLRDNCDPVVSRTGRFSVNRASTCGDNLPPALVSPVGSRTSPGNVHGRARLTWNPVERAIGYRVWIGRNGEAFADVTITRETSVELNLPDALYGWYVEALFEGCTPMPSERAFFHVGGSQPACSTAAPAPIAPAQGSTVTGDVTFSWNGVAGAEGYRVYASLSGGEARLIGATEGTSLTRTLPPGTITWTVEAVFARCPSTFSPRVQFTVARAQNCPTTGATLVSPANGATNLTAPVDFVWNAVSGATRYVLILKVNDGAPTPVASTTETHHVVEKLPPGVIEWWVVAFLPSCEPIASAHARFTVALPQNCETRKPILLIPDRNTFSPVEFQWTRVPRATGYRVFVAQSGGRPNAIATTTEPKATATMPAGVYEWYVEALFQGCPSTESARGEFRVRPAVACGTPTAPEARVVGQALSNTEYRLRWNRVPNAGLYEVQEASSPDFSNARAFTTSDTSMTFTHEVTGAPVQYIYRVRAVSNCNDERSAYSTPVGVFVVAPRTNNASAEIGTEARLVQTVFLPGSTDPYTFVATADKPWLTITPSSGTLPPQGITLSVTADPTVLDLGTNTGTINVQYTAGTKSLTPKSDSPSKTTVPISISLVTPVLPTGKGTPAPDSLIFPAVGHAVGANESLFESDVRITNLTASTMKYELLFTPSGTDGTQNGSSASVEIDPGETLAYDDIVASLFGTGTVTSATGMLEVRPLTTSSSPSTSFFPPAISSLIRELDTAASSRTYNFTPNGTFGQYIPAIRFADFIGKAEPGELTQLLSLQQIAQSAEYRSNFGFAEASGSSVEMLVRVFDVRGGLLATIPVALGPSEHRQLNGMLVANGINDLKDGRVEIEVTGGEGKVTAYASTVDNRTNDPLMVLPVVRGAIASNRYIVPGTAYLNNGFAFWVTDMRIFNAGATATPATLTYYPMANPAGALTRQITVDAGETEVLDNVMGDLFAQPNGAAGMIVITTPTDTQLTATARTYNRTSTGTYGQFIPGVTPAESFGLGDRALQLLQLEHSSRFRTNIGLAETTGNPVTVEVSVTVPELITTPVATISLAPNEFRQLSLGEFNLGTVYNGRVSVRVIAGSGRVTAYGSAIDQITQDPTYVPAQ